MGRRKRESRSMTSNTQSRKAQKAWQEIRETVFEGLVHGSNAPEERQSTLPALCRHRVCYRELGNGLP